MTSAQRKRLSFSIGLIISIILLWVLFRDVHFEELWTALRGANYFWLLPNMALVILAMYQRAHRWSHMIRPVKAVSLNKLVAATFIGFMANNVLPLRLGEFVRAYSLAYQDKEVSKSASLATIFVERMVFDLVALLVIFCAVVSVAAVEIPDEMRTGIYLAIGIALTGIIFVLVLALKPDRTSDLLTKYLVFLPERLRETIGSIVTRFSWGLIFIKKPKTVGWVSLHTLLIWLVMGISNYSVFLAFGFDLPLDASFFLLVVVSISILVPSSPGFVGVYHAGTVFSLMQYGIGRADALSFALVLHAAQYIPITLLGFYFLRKEHLSLKQLEDEAVENIQN
ncbi:MAG: hypothetical protein DRP45_03655 [Candidatus Zixiibacteriota bacterium]|nr:MAG: hypothetical protein DRP45_03655 [candidate division Zixibacteria bacterium]